MHNKGQIEGSDSEEDLDNEEAMICFMAFEENEDKPNEMR